MNVEFIRSHRIGHHRFTQNQVENLPASIAHDLLTLNVVRPVPGDHKGELAALRIAIGARPFDPHVYHNSRETLTTCKPGQSVLIIRKYGGLGDIYIASYVLNEVHKRFPENPITFATTKRYHELFRNVPWMTLLDYETVHQEFAKVRGGIIQSEVAQRYDVVEDISTPCHVWECVFKAHDFTREGLKWRNRAEMWLGWMGITGVESLETCITLSRNEIENARIRYLPKTTKKIVLVSPTSALDSKDYPFWGALCDRLARAGYAPVRVGDPKKVGGCLSTRTTRELLGVIAASWLTISVDSAVFHGAGVMGKSCIGLFNINDGAAYCKFYPHATPLQLCDTPCIMRDAHKCEVPGGKRANMTCYRADSVDKIMELVEKGRGRK